MSNANERLARLEAKEELWSEYNQVGGRFGMHPNFHYLKGIEVSTGSLGHGRQSHFHGSQRGHGARDVPEH